jgi:signal transduction histidine kinase
MTRPWSLRRRLIFASLAWTLMLMTLLFALTFLTNHIQIRVISFIHLGLVVFIGILGVSAGVVQLRLGLSPFKRLRSQLLAVRDGRAPNVTGVYPAEVQPLVDDLNALLAEREEAVRRAQAKAGDLAHGLKTPLAIIAHEAVRVRAGDAEFAALVGHEVDRMRRQIDYHLAHARAAASGGTLGARSAVRDSVDGLVRTLQRLHADRGLTIDVDVPADHMVRCEREDLDEMLGNLIDNACKWARSRVRVSSTRAEGVVAIMVDDDGPGLEAAMREAVLQRGVRADEAAPGSGIGLAIVRDLAELYRGSIALTDAAESGLRAALSLPGFPPSSLQGFTR